MQEITGFAELLQCDGAGQVLHRVGDDLAVGFEGACALPVGPYSAHGDHEQSREVEAEPTWAEER